jgi:hypothetical protein
MCYLIILAQTYYGGLSLLPLPLLLLLLPTYYIYTAGMFRVQLGYFDRARYLATRKILEIINRIGVIRILALRVTPIFSNKTHALNT